MSQAVKKNSLKSISICRQRNPFQEDFLTARHSFFAGNLFTSSIAMTYNSTKNNLGRKDCICSLNLSTELKKEAMINVSYLFVPSCLHGFLTQHKTTFLVVVRPTTECWTHSYQTLINKMAHSFAYRQIFRSHFLS